MAKKRKVSRPVAEATGPRDVNAADARLGPIKSFTDVADEQEEYFMNQDKILFDDLQPSKRLKRQQEEDDFFEPSDEEVLADDDEGSSDDDVPRRTEAPPSRKHKPGKGALDSDEEDQPSDGPGDEGWWGSSRKDYYDADQIQTEADAQEEEAEARRIQKNKLSKMSEADFIFDADEWAAAVEEDAEGENVITEVLQDLEVPDDLSPDARLELLQARYPELDHLLDDFQELQPLLAVCQKDAEGKPTKSVEVVKFWLLGAYVGAIASYLAILTSGHGGDKKLLDPASLRDHEVMETLVECRAAWLKVKDLQPPRTVAAQSEALERPEAQVVSSATPVAKAPKKRTEAERLALKKKRKADKEKLARAKELEASLADLSELLVKPKQTSKAKAAARDAAPGDQDDNDSDFGDEEVLGQRAAADKAARKKTLKFYTSQITQKANKRAEAGRDMGGDMDIPVRERLRDRQERLMATAEKRGKAGKLGADLGAGNESDDEVDPAGKAKDDNEYYDMLATTSRRKKDDKTARKEALAAAHKNDRVVPHEITDEDGRRVISYEIERNKGLTPHRKKINRNPRVKKRVKYEEKKKKLASQKALYKGGEARGGYAGEQTGIKAGLVKSVKL